MKSDDKSISFVEDTAVAPEKLRDYIERFLQVVKRHHTSAGVYAHASVGCLHVRPVVNVKTPTKASGGSSQSPTTWPIWSSTNDSDLSSPFIAIESPSAASRKLQMRPGARGGGDRAPPSTTIAKAGQLRFERVEPRQQFVGRVTVELHAQQCPGFALHDAAPQPVQRRTLARVIEDEPVHHFDRGRTMADDRGGGAERGEWSKRVLGVSFDGTGYGDDDSIWGGEIFVGSVKEGFERVAHLRSAALPGGDAAAQYPVQAAAGFLAQLDSLPDMTAAPFNFPQRFGKAAELVTKGMRTFSTTSMGRLFDTVAALLGFTREISFEGQAAMWVEQLARNASITEAYAFPFAGGELDFRPLLQSVVRDRQRGRDPGEIARAFQRGVAAGLRSCAITLCNAHALDTIVLSGGVFQNELLLEDIKSLLAGDAVCVWTNHAVPPNDGGISLGQAALAAFAPPLFLTSRHPELAEDLA